MADNALMRHRQMQKTQRAFTDQFDKPTPQDYPVVERGNTGTFTSSMLPIATYANGQTGLAWPGMIAEDIPNALTAPARAYRGELGDYQDNRDAYLSEGLNFAGTAAVGGSVVPKPTNTAGVFGGNLPSGIKAKRSTNANGQTNYTLTDETAGAPVGSAYVRDLGDNVQVGRVSIADDYQRQGIGTALYGQIESDLGKKLVPDETLSPSAYSFWMKHHPERVGNYTPPSSADGFYLKSREAGTGTSSGDPVALQALLDSIEGKGTTLAANSRSSTLPGTILAEAADMASKPLAYSGSGSVIDQYTRGPWASDSKAVANSYAANPVPAKYREMNGWPEFRDEANVTPMRFDFKNPLEVDAAGGKFNGFVDPRDQSITNTNRLADEALNKGHDGLIIRNVVDDVQGDLPPATSYHAVRPGTTYSALTGDLLFANGKTSAPGVLLSEAADKAPRVANPIRAYHGSPHDFDKFDLSKIGTGEGAQAFGHGLYFAEREGVARSYQNKLSAPPGQFNWMSARNPKQYRFEALPDDGVPKFHDDTTIRDLLANPQYLNEMNAASLSGVKRLKKELEALEKEKTSTLASVPERYRASTTEDYDRRIERLKQNLAQDEGAAAELDAFVRNGMKLKQGRMYEVAIHADPNDFLDWDKPLSQQSEKVRNAVEAEQRLYYGSQYDGQAPIYADKPVNEALSAINPRNAVPEYLSENLKGSGVPGIRYLDQGSRTAGEGSRNFVVFDDALIEILRKYGLLGTLGAGAAASSFGAPPAEAAPVNALMRR